MDKSVWSYTLFELIDFICKHDSKTSKDLAKYLSKQIWSPSDRQEVLNILSNIFVDGRISGLGELLRPILLDILTRCRLKIEGSDFSFQEHLSFCVVLAACLQWIDIQRFTLNYIDGKPGLLTANEAQEPRKKKAKKCHIHNQTLCRAAWQFTKHIGDENEEFIAVDDLLPYLNSTDNTVKWYACQAIIEKQKMSALSQETFLQNYFTYKEVRELKIRLSWLSTEDSSAVTQNALCVPQKTNEQSHTRHMIIESDFCELVSCVGGVILPKIEKAPPDIQYDLLPVPSNESNLHSIAMAVSSGSPVLLQGVVGSGKTTLAEHLAKLTGRVVPPAFMKIQLGDQMDSKALLGTYQCTEVPGEFVWRAGVLTQAVTKGYWVLLEDIDYAPMEVISVLLPLLETRCLSIPGHGDNIKAAPGFHLFATQRLVSGCSGWQRQQTSTSLLLDKLFTTVLVEPLSRPELSKVLCTLYPKLETVVEKLLDIYFLLSAGGHLVAPDVAMETEEVPVNKFLSRDGRLISTRDLMTWCRRIARDFDVTSTATANLVFQEALDCFVACLSNKVRRLPLSEAIGAHLNMTKVKVEYYCENYKPEVSVTPNNFTVGRVSLPVKQTVSLLQTRKRSTFSYTRQSSILLERIAVCVYNREPVLLVGETGTGKTSSVQYLAEQLGHKLHVINMNQQSDSADLLGGFKPVDVRHIIRPVYEDFELLFCKSFSRKQNAKFLGHLQDCFGKRKWETMFELMQHTTSSALKKFENESKKLKKWKSTSRRLFQLKLQVQQTQNALAFTFMEGSLVKAIRAGDWVLLDEINLAAMETLECLSGLLERNTGSVLLMERGDVEPVERHPDFRLFACMNPATDVGKKDLSPGIRNRFTEVYVDELEESKDLRILVSDYLSGLSLNAGQISGIVKFYLTIRAEAAKKLTDGTGHPPHYSLRTLCRALRFAARNSCGSVPRSIYEGFCLSFLTQVDRVSHPIVEQFVCRLILEKSNMKTILKQSLPAPVKNQSLKFEGFWIGVGDIEPVTPADYILTPSVRANLRDLARVVSAGQHPVLLQGETSVGKTSLIRWLAQSSGNVCVRVNNHEHTDLQEYVGSYAADDTGKLAFKEGVLVEAMKKGHWIILDELNLAPSDVLEALNRLLDDNRELYIPEIQETVKAHAKFMLFATQNPPGQYGGRKMLSRAFRNRFVELHFDEIPSKELETILHEKCAIPLSYARRLITVMLELQTRRRGSGVFAGKMGFMTLRDLFRWADRYKCPEMDNKKFYNWDKHLADQGYMLLAGRVRKAEEADVVQEVIEKHFKCKLSAPTLFTLNSETSLTSKSTLEEVVNSQSADGFHHVVWTYGMRRLAVLIGQAIKYKEPVLLVGETGCGKTTVCQLYAALYKSVIHSVNCHLHTESADFLGGLRPVRDHSDEDKKDQLFEWVDGPLVKSMKEGAMFLIDEISLADDSVLERLNSVLEPERAILLAEKGGGTKNEVEQVVAKQGFHVFATMNPGGDFGKKELSPALRNRFTEIWCPPSTHRQDLVDIIEHNLNSGIHLCNQEDGTSGIGRAVMDFIDWFSNNDLGRRCTVSIRDILTWVQFINACSRTLDTDISMETGDGVTCNQLEPAVAYVHGACLVFLDGLGAGTTSQGRDDQVSQMRSTSLTFLLKQVNSLTHQEYTRADLCLLDNKHVKVTSQAVMETETEFCIPPFSIAKGVKVPEYKAQYALQAPGTCVNAQRVLRALQLPRPLLLEGNPGVGKTSLVSALARAAGRDLVRINLSDQTDVTDLFGADLPVEGAEGGVFAWRDGPLLRALKTGSWIVLDELNLASQSVLEGLNACLDHRAEIFIPELAKTFHIQHEKTRLFGCQNPLNQGGGRKGLPRSFLNRFTQVYVEPLTEADLMFIASTMYPSIAEHTLILMVKFNMKMHEETVVHGKWGQKGSPWEFNLRDLFRWCDLLIANQSAGELNPGEYMSLIFADRMRTVSDNQQVYSLYDEMFPSHMPSYRSSKIFHFDPHQVQIGHSFLEVKGEGHHQGNNDRNLEILHHSLVTMESVLKCVQMNWMSILVGSPSSGKSSIVEMLARLTGNHLSVLAMNSAMDTTELLGGFEQADEHRHIEEISADMRDLVQTICNQCLLLGDKKHLTTVSKLQNKCRQMKRQCGPGDGASSLEEVNEMKKAVSDILSVITECKKAVKHLGLPTAILKTIKSRKTKLLKLQEKISLAAAGKGGGSFEWVDSLLVKSLTLGHWLIIDNVNFCSASVLDRLNALLEPHGILSINERGVIDGEIPSIRPHPNFRLFLVMDSRHGEISRAMRNRGVEIYIHGEEDGHSFSEFDLRKMFNGLGLKLKPVFDWLLNLHSLLREELPMGDKPSDQCLLKACNQVLQHCNHGYDLRHSVRTACYSVYVQSQRHTKSKRLSLDILNKQFDEDWSDTITADGSCQAELGISPVCIRGVTMETQDATVSKNVAVFVHMMETRDTEDAVSAGMKLKHALSMTLHLSSDNTLPLTIDWLQNYCKNKHQSVDVSQYVVASLQEVYGVLRSQKVKDTPDLLTLETSGSYCPLDLRWNQQMLQKYLQKHEATRTEDMETFFNRLHCQLRYQTDVCFMQKYVNTLQAALEKDRQRGKQTTHEAVFHLNALFTPLTSAITDAIASMSLPNYGQATKVLESLLWLARLYEVASTSLRKPEAGALLSLYWKWTQHRALDTCIQDISVHKKIAPIVGALQDILSKDDRLWKLFVTFWRSWGHPRPFEGQVQADMQVEAMTLFRLLVPGVNMADAHNEVKVTLLVSRRQFLVDVATAVLNMTGSVEADEVECILSPLRNLLTSHKLISQDAQYVAMETDMQKTVDHTDDSEGASSDLPMGFVALWPIFEHCSVMEAWMLMQKMLGGTLDQDVLDSYVDYVTQFTPIQPFNIALFKTMCDKNTKFELSSVMVSVLKSLQTCSSLCNPTQWLTWSRQHQHDHEKPPSIQFSLHQAALTHSMFSLLSTTDDSVAKETHNNVKIGAPLKSYTRELIQLNHLSRHIWTHVSSYSSQHRSNKSQERNMLLSTFVQTLTATLPLLADDMPELASKLTTMADDIDHITVQDVDDVQALFLSCPGDGPLHDRRDLWAAMFTAVIVMVTDDTGDVTLLGEAWIHLGLVAMEMLVPCGPVDPVEKVSIKLDISKQELLDVETELEILSMHHRLVTGLELRDVSSRLVHPRVAYLLQKTTELAARIEQLEKQVAYRPTPSQYGQLVTDAKSFLSSVASVQNVQKIVNKLKKIIKKPSSAKLVTMTFNEVDLWLRSEAKFTEMLEVEYPMYRDITMPFVCALQQMVHGMHILYHEVKRHASLRAIFTKKSLNFQDTCSDLERLIVTMGKFPTLSHDQPSCLRLAITLTSASNLDLVREVLSAADQGQTEMEQSLAATDSILCSSMHHVFNEACTRGHLTVDLVATLTGILQVYMLSWQHQEEARREMEEEQASLYRFKSQVHGDERSEEEREEAEFHESFPQFTKDFVDLTEPTTLEESGQQQQQIADNILPETFALQVSSAQMNLINSVHRQFYKHLVNTDWYHPDTMTTRKVSDWLQPLLSSYTGASMMTLRLSEILGSHIDSALLGGHLAVSAIQQFYILQASEGMVSALMPEQGTYDIYHDPNVPEVVQCLAVLQGLRSRVQALQEEWPDHPTLKQLCDVMDRIEGFSITCPVMKFLTGIELLLQTSQDWESNASQHVSMATQLSELSRLIVQWRKLELDCWYKCLDTELHKYRSGVSKWWFHIYQLIQSVLTTQEESDDAPLLEQIITTLKQFIEQASLGDFHARLDMILSFHCQLVALTTRGQGHCNIGVSMTTQADDNSESVAESIERCETGSGVNERATNGFNVRDGRQTTVKVVQNVLWNIYKFYSQFSDTVTAELEKLRHPIEKELKGFVKIARWSDINFWALKQTAEKTHRTLHKQIKQFQTVMRQAVQGILGDSESGASTAVPGADHSSWTDKLQQYHEDLLQQLKVYKYPEMATVHSLVEAISDQVPLQMKLPQLCSRLNKHWRHIVHKAQYCEHIASLDHFTTELIADIHELQALEINRNEEKEKQKSEAKHMNLRKRKALSDLFKYLQKLGLSYRKGVTISSGNEDLALKVAPLNLGVALHGDSDVEQVWSGCSEYFYKCISRRALFNTALLTPSKELGIGNIDRCKGFTEHLYKLLMTQHNLIATMTAHYMHVRKLVQSIEEMSSESRVLVQQTEACTWVECCRNLLVQMVEGLNQFLVVLHCCPCQQGQVTLHPSPIRACDLHEMALVKPSDEIVQSSINTVQELLSEVKISESMLPHSTHKVILLWSDIQHVQTVFHKMAATLPRIQHLSKLFTDTGSDQPNAFTEVLHFLCTEVASKVGDFTSWFTSIDDVSVTKMDVPMAEMENTGTASTTDMECDSMPEEITAYAGKVEHLVSRILLVVQKQSHLHAAQETELDGQEEQEDVEDLREGHLVKQILENLHKSSQLLESEQLLRSLTSLLSAMVTDTSRSTSLSGPMLHIVHQCSPLLSQYSSIFHHHLVSAVATQRTMGKLLSVLLAVFTELATKGFCIPPELSDEMAGEGATEFCDMENAGMGEGEGVKNVSDQIENEDQLDEAKRPEDHKKEDQSNQPDVQSEENAIEMSDDIDAKVQDLDDVDKQEDDDDEKADDTEEIDKQMGDVDEQDTEKLDEQMWGSDNEDEDISEEKKEESGPGDGKQSEPELVAKDDNEDKSSDDKDDQKQTEDGEEENEKEKQPHNLDMDQENYDDDQVDPYHGKQEEQQAPEDLDLPDDLHLDDDLEEDAGKEGEEPMEDKETEEDSSKLPPEETGDEPDQTPADTAEDNTEDNTNDKNDDEKETGEDDKNEADKQTDEQEKQEDEGADDPGFTPQDESVVEALEKEEEDKPSDDVTQAVEHHGKTSHDTADENVEQSDTAQDAAGETQENDQQEVDGTGQASVDQSEGHQGQRSTTSMDASTGKRKQPERQPGKSDSDRSLGSTDQKYKRLKTTENTRYNEDTRDQNNDSQNQEERQADMYEHVKDSESHYDTQTLDVATAEQQEKQGQISQENEEAESDADSDTKMADDEDDKQEMDTAENISSAKLKKKSKTDADDNASDLDDDLEMKGEGHHEVPGDKVETTTVARGADSTIHTAMEHLNIDFGTFDLEGLRSELESQLGSWSQSNLPLNTNTESTAGDLWHRYEALTASLAQDLCEQLRLVLEPSQATKLKGDYRTGKRLNMRKVIPYIASQFRKDKIWLRRTKPSKRQYQIMLAIDDSSSMVDNHSKQMAFESLCLVSNALTLLESGQLSICSFGEVVNVLHPFREQFTSQSGAHLLQYLTFEQKKTKIAQLLQQATAMMIDARQNQHGSMGNPDTSQLLLIVSDGRGLFMEGMEVVKSAVRQANEAKVFIVFVIIDNPVNKDSILDIKVPVFKPGGLAPEIKSYMDSFPFPFYIILRDINSLPLVLSDALRQWFELVTAVDR